MKHVVDIIPGPLEAHAARIPTRKRQKVSIPPDADEAVFLICKGLYLARAPMPHDRHQVLSILYPGDILRASALPPLDGVEITAASEGGEIWRVRWSAVETLIDQDPDFARSIADRLSDQAARIALHNAIVSTLTGDERVAALLIELALRTGSEGPSGLLFDMPLSRIDIAEYLALNADTVSRIVSRMRANGLYAPAGASRVRCTNFEALTQACPLAAALARMHASSNRLPVMPAV